jgi:nicotinamidase/pyrazinamidase
MKVQPPILFFDVDTQIDFLEPNGALYVPGAETLQSNFERLIDYARKNNIPIWGSVDAHNPSDAELSRSGGAFPDHCMRGEPGQQKIAATKPLHPFWIENRNYQKSDLLKIKRHSNELYFLKQSFNVFDNPNMRRLSAPFATVVIFGVATDYCVLAAVLGFREMKKSVFLVADAIKPVNVNPGDGEAALQKMQKAGAILTTTDAICEGRLNIDQ